MKQNNSPRREKLEEARKKEVKLNKNTDRGSIEKSSESRHDCA